MGNVYSGGYNKGKSCLRCHCGIIATPFGLLCEPCKRESLRKEQARRLTPIPEKE